MSELEWSPTEHQRRIVGLYEAGYGRWKIAEIIGISEGAVRKTVQSMCRRFECSTRELPAMLAEFDDADDDGRVTV